MTKNFTRRSVLGAGGALAATAVLGTRGAEATTVWQSELVRYDARYRLVYREDTEGNRIPDFSHAGYRHGDRPIPHVRTVKTVRPIEGDNTAHLQAALDEVGARPLGRTGHRGAVLLAPGNYPVAGTVRVNQSGVVLRGSGDGADPRRDTIIQATGNTPVSRDVVVLGGSGPATGWRGEVAGTRTDITSDWVQVGSRSFEVADASGLRAGDNIIIVHPCTEAWLAAVDHGGTATDAGWTVDSQPITYNRRITGIRGTTVTIDVPVFEHLRRDRSQSYLYVWDRAGLVTEVGVERVRIDIQFAGDPDTDEAHAFVAVKVRQVEDAWVRNSTFLHFAKAGVETTEATRVTVRDCDALDPASVVTGGLRYNFNCEAFSQQVLFVDCHATKARHAFISNGASSASGIVFLRGTSVGALASSEGHRRWSQGLLWDNFVDRDPKVDLVLGIYNRGDYGTGHGWATSHSVGWNCDTGTAKLVVQKPPTAQNYAIGCQGVITGDGPFEQPAGYIEGANRRGLFPPSLYQAQCLDRHR
ncbi:hypothetical protein BWI15_24175 [Kribbella sp. ALI-6-A]|uniref:hypothetical protein n=1 Tax=Kribbella sp. ALI-6-A TaxID=1933817 RepID=UPI00097BF2F7|nr:hypothetical protein [Kribbella sp. ALI-6-A]ONI69656.1 hypothetical protein BWI15_24175 [Kribbella sp. ALI-6-A]